MKKTAPQAEEKIFSAYHFYALPKHLNNTYRVTLVMRDALDGEILRRAVDATVPRYPYFLIRRKNTFTSTRLVPNGAPVVVREGDALFTLGCEESNGHLFGVTYKGNELYLDFFHGLTDGNGLFPFVKTLLYFYCKERYDADLSSDGVRLPGEEIPEGEFTDPFPRRIPKGLTPLSPHKLFGHNFHLKKDPRVHVGEKVTTPITIDAGTLMKRCKTSDGSPAVYLSVLLARAVHRLNPKTKKPISGGLAINLRPAFGAPLAHHSATDILRLPFEDKLFDMPIDKQNTACRGKVILQSDRDTVLSGLRAITLTFRVIEKLPCLALKRALCGAAVPPAFGANTFFVSYAGKNDFGAADPYVEQFYVALDSVGIGIAMEISTVRGQFFLDFMQDFPEPLYLDAFLEELAAQEIPFTRGETKPLLTPKCRYRERK